MAVVASILAAAAVAERETMVLQVGSVEMATLQINLQLRPCLPSVNMPGGLVTIKYQQISVSLDHQSLGGSPQKFCRHRPLLKNRYR